MIRRYWETVRHLRPAQIVSRVRLRSAARARRLFPSASAGMDRRRAARSGLHWRDQPLDRDAVAMILRERAELSAGTAGDIARGRFDFLNEPGDLGWPPDWAAPSHSRLWRYHLHYFDFAGTLAGDAAVPLLEHWISANPVHGGGATADAWHPYVASLRLVNWMLLVSASPEVATPRVRTSLEEHALFVERNLESDVGGNHLLKNLKAMTFAGCFWDGTRAARWRERYGGQFSEELHRQLLADGAHYERSPMYHSQVLADAIEVAAVAAARQVPALPRIRESIGRMDRHLAQVTHPDGGIALFNDSAFGMTPRPAALHQAAASVAPAASPAATDADNAAASGYVVLAGPDAHDFLIADVGAVCPDDLPAHAHADLLSFELSVNGVRMIVDSGVGEYAAGPWRDYYRSTRAHNTVSVDGAEQSDCWASFRVGRRARPVDVRLHSADGRTVLEAAHTGFEHLRGGVRHRRTFTQSADHFWAVTDVLTGGGTHDWSSYCHFHPDVRITGRSESWLRLERGAAVLDVCWYGAAEAQVITGQSDPLQGWYAERFGPARPNHVLVLTGRAPLPVGFGYALVPRESAADPPASIDVSTPGSRRLRIGDATFEL